MAIEKEVTRVNGLTFNYHRVVSVHAIANHSCIIEVASYLNHEQRKIEAAALAGNQPMDVIVSTQYVSAPYEPNMGITGAYDYIKGVDPFKGSENVFEVANDPVAVADAVATGAMVIEDVPEQYRSEIEALIPTKPADKEGFLTVAHIEPMGYRVLWDFVKDPNYDPDREDGTFLKPFRFLAGMEVVLGKWYWLDDKQLPHECIKSGTPGPMGFYDREFFDFIEEEPGYVEPTVEPEEPEDEPMPTEPDMETQEPVEGPVEVEKTVVGMGDFTNPIPYVEGMEVNAGLWYYLDDPELPREAQADGLPDGWEDAEYLI